MYTTYHLTSAQEVNSDILDAIKATFKSKPKSLFEITHFIFGFYLCSRNHFVRLF